MRTSNLFAAAHIISLVMLSMAGNAQEVFGFHRDDFGKVTLSRRQVGAGPVNTTNYKSEPVGRYATQSLIVELGRPVGRLDILTDAGVFPCTAFLISDRHILTNYHCVPGIIDQPSTKAKYIERASLLLGYIKQGVAEGTSRFDVVTTPVESSKDLDYSILEIKGVPNDKFGRVKIGVVEPNDNEPYIIIGHPEGWAQHVSREGCASSSPAVSEARLRHECDTLPGNSGSPVLDHVSNRALAIHHAGSSLHGINYAVPFSIIIQHSAVLRDQLIRNRTKEKLVVFWHEHGLTENKARFLESYLAKLGVEVMVHEHRDTRAPDAIYIRPDADVDIVRIVLGSLPYRPQFIFPVDYENSEVGMNSNFTMAVGLRSTHRYVENNHKEIPHAVSGGSLAYLVEDGISETEFLRRLQHIAPARANAGTK